MLVMSPRHVYSLLMSALVAFRQDVKVCQSWQLAYINVIFRILVLSLFRLVLSENEQ